MRNIWRRRCDIVHGITGKLTSKRERGALRKEIRQQFQLGPDGVRANDKELLERPKSTMLNYSFENQKYWVRTLKNSRTFVDDFKSSMFTGMRGIMQRWASVPIRIRLVPVRYMYTSF